MLTHYILNFAHPLNPKIIAQLSPCIQIKVPFHMDLAKATYPQVVSAVNGASKLMEEKGGVLDGSFPIIFVPPTLSEAAILMISEIHGRTGIFPKMLSIRRHDDEWLLFGNSSKIGVVDLNLVRGQARGRRGRGRREFLNDIHASQYSQ